MRPGLAALVALVLLATPAAAEASSIVLVRDGDLYLVTPDGGFERRLTAGGGYDSPSMADKGGGSRCGFGCPSAPERARANALRRVTLRPVKAS